MGQSVLLKNDEKIEKVTNLLNQQVANLNVFYMKLHHFHWYVKGPHFFSLHAKFEEMYDEVTLHMDEVAERILTVGGKPISTLKQCISDAAIKEAAGEDSETKMVESVRTDLITMTSQMKEGMKIAEDNGDVATSDMLLAIKSSFEKHMWMMSSYLEK